MERYSFDPIVPPPADDGGVQRHDSRDSLFLAAQLTIGSLPSEQVRVRNLSAGGMMAEHPSSAMVGTKVRVELRGIGVVGGRIAWVTDGRIGIAFDRQIDPLLARKPVSSRPTTRR